MPTNRLAYTKNPVSQPASGGVAYKANPSNYGNATSKVINLNNNNWLSDSVVFTVDSAWRYVVHVRNSHNGASSIHIDDVRVYGMNTATYLACDTASGGYRFGFGGQEKENDISGVEGGHLSYQYRIHDARLGRFLSVDPLAPEYPWNSTYAFAENCVIRFIDLEGLEIGPTPADKMASGYNSTAIDATNSAGINNQVEINSRMVKFEFVPPVQPVMGPGGIIGDPAYKQFKWQMDNVGPYVVPGLDLLHEYGSTGSVSLSSIGISALTELPFGKVFKTPIGKKVLREVGGIGAELFAKNFKNIDKVSSRPWFRYQQQITGLPGNFEIDIKGVKFDGFKDGKLLEAKGVGYQKILDGAYGQKAIEDGQNSLRAQAVRQIKAANGIPIEWHFAEKGVADKMREVFDKKGLNIKVIHTPMDWSK